MKSQFFFMTILSACVFVWDLQAVQALEGDGNDPIFSIEQTVQDKKKHLEDLKQKRKEIIEANVRLHNEANLSEKALKAIYRLGEALGEKFKECEVMKIDYFGDILNTIKDKGYYSDELLRYAENKIKNKRKRCYAEYVDLMDKNQEAKKKISRMKIEIGKILFDAGVNEREIKKLTDDIKNTRRIIEVLERRIELNK